MSELFYVKVCNCRCGVGGLYTAIRLIKKGINPKDITLIDPRAGEYTRPGYLQLSTFDKVMKKIQILSEEPSPASHIKELERMMYEELKEKKVTFVKERFVHLQQETDSQVKAVLTDNSTEMYPADFVFDCTGKEAFVAKAINFHQQNRDGKSFFKSTLLADINPIPDHLVAQVLIPKFNPRERVSSTLIVNRMFREESLPQENIKIIERLKYLGWTYEAFPTFYSYPQGKEKVCLYMETPSDFPAERQKSWIKLLLDIYSENRLNEFKELKPSKKFDKEGNSLKKPRIVGFKSTPYVLSNAVFQSKDLPTVIPGFDALKGFDYRLGNGVKSGVDCCELMLKHITINKGRIEHINAEALDESVFEYINGKYKESLINLLNSRQEAIRNSKEYFTTFAPQAALELVHFKFKIFPQLENRKNTQENDGFSSESRRAMDSKIRTFPSFFPTYTESKEELAPESDEFDNHGFTSCTIL